ncbi:MAG: SCP2 sterol-binding domain-containing protein [Anaerolineae bacterium]
MTPQELFDKMPETFNPAKAAGVDVTVQIDLTGDNGGTWSVKIAGGKCTVDKAASESPNLTITMDAADYMAMVKGELPAMNAFMQGKIKLQGDMGLAMKFQGMFN